MSECDECRKQREDDDPEVYCPCSESQVRELGECTAAPFLKALPTATEQQIRIATAVLRGEYDCGHCSVTADFGDGKLHPCRVYEDVPYGWPCEHWTQRDKEA